MMRNTIESWSPDNEARIPRELPILLITGEADPVSEGGVGVRALEARYREAGIKDVTGLYYPYERHELLNEIIRDDVREDIAEWLERVV